MKTTFEPCFAAFIRLQSKEMAAQAEIDKPDTISPNTNQSELDNMNLTREELKPLKLTHKDKT